MKSNGDLEQEEVQAIREWLKSPNKSRECPFKELPDWGNVEGWYCHKLCPSIFPTLAEKRLAHMLSPMEVKWGALGCPCTLFSHSYVTRRARLLVVRNGRRRRER